MRFANTLVLVSMLAAGCGGSEPGGDVDAATGGIDAPGGPDLGQRYLPRKVGSRWRYHTVDLVTNASGDLDTVVEAYEATPGHAGLMSYRTRIAKLDGSSQVWEAYDGDVGARYATVDYDLAGAVLDTQSAAPYRIKVDETAAHLVANATYSESFALTTTDSTGTTTNTKTENWLVVSLAESVTVPAGTFTALHVRRTNAGSNKMKDYWYVKGMGKVKEMGADATGNASSEELISYTP